jgi:hypothetical protein
MAQKAKRKRLDGEEGEQICANINGRPSLSAEELLHVLTMFESGELKYEVDEQTVREAADLAKVKMDILKKKAELTDLDFAMEALNKAIEALNEAKEKEKRELKRIKNEVFEISKRGKPTSVTAVDPGVAQRIAELESEVAQMTAARSQLTNTTNALQLTNSELKAAATKAEAEAQEWQTQMTAVNQSQVKMRALCDTLRKQKKDAEAKYQALETQVKTGGQVRLVVENSVPAVDLLDLDAAIAAAVASAEARLVAQLAEKEVQIKQLRADATEAKRSAEKLAAEHKSAAEAARTLNQKLLAQANADKTKLEAECESYRRNCDQLQFELERQQAISVQCDLANKRLEGERNFLITSCARTEEDLLRRLGESEEMCLRRHTTLLFMETERDEAKQRVAELEQQASELNKVVQELTERQSKRAGLVSAAVTKLKLLFPSNIGALAKTAELQNPDLSLDKLDHYLLGSFGQAAPDKLISEVERLTTPLMRTQDHGYVPEDSLVDERKAAFAPTQAAAQVASSSAAGLFSGSSGHTASQSMPSSALFAPMAVKTLAHPNTAVWIPSLAQYLSVEDWAVQRYWCHETGRYRPLPLKHAREACVQANPPPLSAPVQAMVVPAVPASSAQGAYVHAHLSQEDYFEVRISDVLPRTSPEIVHALAASVTEVPDDIVQFRGMPSGTAYVVEYRRACTARAAVNELNGRLVDNKNITCKRYIKPVNEAASTVVVSHPYMKAGEVELELRRYGDVASMTELGSLNLGSNFRAVFFSEDAAHMAVQELHSQYILNGKFLCKIYNSDESVTLRASNPSTSLVLSDPVTQKRPRAASPPRSVSHDRESDDESDDSRERIRRDTRGGRRMRADSRERGRPLALSPARGLVLNDPRIDSRRTARSRSRSPPRSSTYRSGQTAVLREPSNRPERGGKYCTVCESQGRTVAACSTHNTAEHRFKGPHGAPARPGASNNRGDVRVDRGPARNAGDIGNHAVSLPTTRGASSVTEVALDPSRPLSTRR